eukprot:jgi/Ulvmu1/10481/UM064_0018.1
MRAPLVHNPSGCMAGSSCARSRMFFSVCRSRVSARHAAGLCRQFAVAPAASAATAAERELPKNFDPAEEEDIYKWWESSGRFCPESSDGTGPPFTMVMPPPNVTGKLHMGHAMFVTLQDIMARFHRMQGRPVLWIPGTDHAGIATQMVVERQLAEEGVKRQDLGREAFIKRVWGWKEEKGGQIQDQLRRLGASCDWTREVFTLSPDLSGAVTDAFMQLHADGLIYRGTYMVNWAPTLQTAVSDLEVEYSDERGYLYVFQYPLADGSGAHLPVATTRPETILGDMAVAVHPEDPRYADMVGKEVQVPMSGGRRIPVIADTYVDMEFGTGALKITPAHDPNDYEIGQRVGLEMLTIMNRDGSMNSNAGKYDGLDRFECRKQLWADMEAAGLAIRKEDYTNRVPRSQRGGEVIEPMVSEQWFVKTGGMASEALAAVEDGRLTILPPRFTKIYNNWLDGIQDWCISRQLWWGHRIPVWYCFKDAAEADSAGGSGPDFVVARNEVDARSKAAEKYGEGVVLRQDEDVLDTWFSSGLWPMSALGWPQQSVDLSRFFPTQMLETGHDILFFWVARMVMLNLYFTGEVPFEKVYLHGLVRDEQGRKMSKSLGNVVDPLDVSSEYGCDALRYTLATGSTPGQDVNLSLDRVTSSRNLTNKIWNASKFVQFGTKDLSEEEYTALAGASFSEQTALKGLPVPERWIVSRLHDVTDAATAALEAYEFGEAGRLMYEFFWFDFADWYIEIAKSRLYSEDADSKRCTQGVLAYVLEASTRLWHPFIPFVTERLWKTIPHEGEALMSASWPASGLPQCQEAGRQLHILKQMVTAVRNARSEYNVEISKKVAAVLCIQDSGLRDLVMRELASICLLAKIDSNDVVVVPNASEAAAGDGAVELVVQEGIEIVLPLKGLFDAAKEIQRLEKQQEKAQKELSGLEARMSNSKFVENAPESVVQEVRDQASELREKVDLIQQKLEQARAIL